MDEESFNLDMRKFLKKVGVTSQRELEEAVREGMEGGKLSSRDREKVEVALIIAGLDVTHEVDGEISLS